MSESYLVKLLEEVQVNDQISAEKRLKRGKLLAVSAFFVHLGIFLLSTDLENQYGYCVFFFLFHVT